VSLQEVPSAVTVIVSFAAVVMLILKKDFYAKQYFVRSLSFSKMGQINGVLSLAESRVFVNGAYKVCPFILTLNNLYVGYIVLLASSYVVYKSQVYIVLSF